MSSKILLTGGSGLLALNWALATRSTHHVTLGLHRRHVEMIGVTSTEIALTSQADCSRSLDRLKPDLVVHTAGMTNVEACEGDPAEAMKVNAHIPGYLASACRERGIALIHISTDHLSSGSGFMVREDIEPAPVNVYAKSKLAGELSVLEQHPGALVVRTNFFGWGPTYRPSFSDVILRSLRKNQRITLFSDVHYTPIAIPLLVSRAMRLQEAGGSGVFNLAGDERLSKYQFGRKLAGHFNLDTSLIREGSIDDIDSLVPRPKDMSVNCEKARVLLGIEPMTCDEQILVLREQETNGSISEIARL